MQVQDGQEAAVGESTGRLASGKDHTGDGQYRNVSPDAAKALDWLTPDLRTTLASLDGAPTAVATAVAQLLPFGSRAVLIDQGLAVGHVEGDPCAVMELTDLAYEVMHAAALAAAANPEAVTDWMRRARAAASS